MLLDGTEALKLISEVDRQAKAMRRVVQASSLMAMGAGQHLLDRIDFQQRWLKDVHLPQLVWLEKTSNHARLQIYTYMTDQIQQEMAAVEGDTLGGAVVQMPAEEAEEEWNVVAREQATERLAAEVDRQAEEMQRDVQTSRLDASAQESLLDRVDFQQQWLKDVHLPASLKQLGQPRSFWHSPCGPHPSIYTWS